MSGRVTPRRRCVGCGRIAPKSELVRLALGGASEAVCARVVLDRAGTMSGRGAYLCADQRSGEPVSACMRLALRRRAIARALRRAVTIDSKLVESVSQ